MSGGWKLDFNLLKREKLGSGEGRRNFSLELHVCTSL